MKQITDEDICAKCGNCHRLTEVGPPPWDVMAVCDEGFPFTRVFHNVISECPSLLLTHNAVYTTPPVRESGGS